MFTQLIACSRIDGRMVDLTGRFFMAPGTETEQTLGLRWQPRRRFLGSGFENQTPQFTGAYSGETCKIAGRVPAYYRAISADYSASSNYTPLQNRLHRASPGSACPAL
ncbi:hypothetical protein NPIL_236191 [Nephila pilipes]|uniref:Uncharacterized protein n=1 Tax=Nephila pilipes TaxID=299642 RepID=A0A8X6NB58_NEPPI|nr:hypothetical protein NPIL_236191 [Nephila pilipes]